MRVGIALGSETAADTWPNLIASWYAFEMAAQELKRINLDDQHTVLIGDLPSHLRFTPAQFEACWSLHPDGFHQVRLFGRRVPVPR